MESIPTALSDWEPRWFYGGPRLVWNQVSDSYRRRLGGLGRRSSESFQGNNSQLEAKR